MSGLRTLRSLPRLHVIVVQEDHEEPHVVAGRFALLVEVVRMFGAAGSALVAVVDLDDLKVSIFCGLPSLEHWKSLRTRSGTWLPLLVADDDVNADAVDAGAERAAAAAAAGGGLLGPRPWPPGPVTADRSGVAGGGAPGHSANRTARTQQESP